MKRGGSKDKGGGAGRWRLSGKRGVEGVGVGRLLFGEGRGRDPRFFCATECYLFGQLESTLTDAKVLAGGLIAQSWKAFL